MMKTYKVTAVPEAKFWLLSVSELDVVTQARTLDRAESTVRDLIAVWLDVAPDSFAVDIEPRLDPEYAQMLAQAKAARLEADESAARASTLVREVVSKLHERGMTARESGSLLGISYQRVQQLLSELAKGPARK